MLSSFAALYALLRIIVWYFRSDKATIDLLTLIRLLIYGADILANVILTVIFFATFYWLITFRQQDEVTVSLPGQQEEQFIKNLVISAFTLKVECSIIIVFLQLIKCASLFCFIRVVKGDQCTVDDRRTMHHRHFPNRLGKSKTC